MSPRRCLRCQTVYEGDARFCPRDGSPLVEVARDAVKSSAPVETPKTAVRHAVKRKPGPTLKNAATLSGQLLDSRYQVVRRLGEGGMSFVYEAKDITSGDNVAVKVLSPKLAQDKNAVERLRREAGVELLTQMCAGLHHAHGLNIIHRDLKPENVMIVPGPDGKETAVVMDFGLAKDKSISAAAQKLTATGIVLGTPEFMSPEQVRGKDLDPRSDVYALGIVAFEMFTGNLPFEGRTPQEMMVARLRGAPVPLRRYRKDLPVKLEKALQKAMQTSPQDRYATVLEFGAAVSKSLEPDEDEGTERDEGRGLFDRFRPRF